MTSTPTVMKRFRVFGYLVELRPIEIILSAESEDEAIKLANWQSYSNWCLADWGRTQREIDVDYAEELPDRK